MNRKDRKMLNHYIENLEELYIDIEDIQLEELEKYGRLEVSLQDSILGDSLHFASLNLSNAILQIAKSISSIKEAMKK